MAECRWSGRADLCGASRSETADITDGECDTAVWDADPVPTGAGSERSRDVTEGRQRTFEDVDVFVGSVTSYTILTSCTANTNTRTFCVFTIARGYQEHGEAVAE